MPTWINHFRVADRLIDKLDNIDAEYFAIGTIAPDCGMLDREHGIYKPYTGVTHFTKEMEYSKKTDCDYEYVYNRYVKNEKDIKKRSFYLAYYIHLFEDCIFAKNLFAPIENQYGDFRYNEAVRRQVARERNNIDFMFIKNNISPTFEIFKGCEPFDESYPDWYAHNEIALQMKNIVRFYSDPNFEDMEYEYLSPKIMNDLVERTVKLLMVELNKKGIIN